MFKQTDIHAPYSQDDVINACVIDLMDDWNKLVEKAKRYGLEIRLAPECDTLELHFDERYPDTLLVRK